MISVEPPIGVLVHRGSTREIPQTAARIKYALVRDEKSSIKTVSYYLHERRWWSEEKRKIGGWDAVERVGVSDYRHDPCVIGKFISAFKKENQETRGFSRRKVVAGYFAEWKVDIQKFSGTEEGYRYDRHEMDG